MGTMGIIAGDHFKGQQNVDDGCRRGSDTTLRELLAQAKVDLLALETLNAKRKTGREAFAAAGDLAVAFAVAFASAAYTVVWSFEDVSGGANDLVGQVKATTKLATGFTVTIAGTTPNGVLHWVAILD